MKNWSDKRLRGEGPGWKSKVQEKGEEEKKRREWTKKERSEKSTKHAKRKRLKEWKDSERKSESKRTRAGMIKSTEKKPWSEAPRKTMKMIVSNIAGFKIMAAGSLHFKKIYLKGTASRKTPAATIFPAGAMPLLQLCLLLSGPKFSHTDRTAALLEIFNELLVLAACSCRVTSLRRKFNLLC